MSKRFFVILISLAAAFGGLMFGFDIAIFSGIIPFIQPYYHLSDAMLGWTGSSLYLGCIFGTFLSGRMTDRWGRKYPLLVSAFIFTVSCTMMGWSGSYHSLIAWRIFAGMGVGVASMLSPLYIAEVSPAAVRGRMVSLNQLAIVIGILIAYFSNFLLAGQVNNWRWMFTTGSVPSLIFFISMLFVPESPRWLIMKGYEKKGRAVLIRISDELTAEKEIIQIRDTLAGASRGTLRDLLKKGTFFIVILGIIIAVFQQISGANAVFFYAPIIFEKAGMSIKNQLFQQLLIGLTNLTFTLVAMRLVDRLGRKKLMLGGSLAMAVWLVVIGMLYHFSLFNGYWLTIIVLFFIATYATTLAPVTWVLIAEIFPIRVRGTAMSVATGMLWVACFALTFVFPVLFGSNHGKGLISPTGNFLLFAGINLLYFFILLKTIPETKGKTLEEIEKEITG